MRSLWSVIVIFVMVVSCHPEKETVGPVVTVSITPQKYLIEKIAGDLVKVNVMVPSGASPASYEPTVQQMKQLDGSVLYMKIGYLGFELSWMDRIRAAKSGLPVSDLSLGIDLIGAGDIHPHGEENGTHHSDGGTDPHIWMSPGNMSIMASTACDALCGIFPEWKDLFRKNLQKFRTELDSLDRQIREDLQGCGSCAFMIYHPALSYFARDYGLVQIPLEFEGKEPSPARMKSVSDRGRELGITAILIQRQFNRRNAEVLARDLEATVVIIDPLDEDWKNQILHITKSLKESWKK
jgi:zinc transport system substrate-binding protein